MPIEYLGLGSPKSLVKWLLNPKMSLNHKKFVIQSEFRRQLSTLHEQKIPISYMDGHHHVHTFPIVASTVLSMAAAQNFLLIRWPFTLHQFTSKKSILNLFSLLALPAFIRARVARHPILYPDLSAFQEEGALVRQMATFKRKLIRLGVSSGEMIVHPAATDDFAHYGIIDNYNKERLIEFKSLLSIEHNTI